MSQSVYVIGNLKVTVKDANRPSTAAMQAANKRINDTVQQKAQEQAQGCRK